MRCSINRSQTCEISKNGAARSGYMSMMVQSLKDELARVSGLVLTKKAMDIEFITQIIGPYVSNAV